MLFNVPQFINIEDKIIGPLTIKQLGWLGAAGVLLIILWNLLDRSAFIVCAIFICAIFGGLAFYRPYNQPLINFVISSVHFVMRPKMYIWRRNYDNIKPISRKPVKQKAAQPKKTLNKDKLKEITQILDRSKSA